MVGSAAQSSVKKGTVPLSPRMETAMSNSSHRRIPKYQLFKPRNLAKVRLEGKDIYLGPYDSPESHDKYKKSSQNGWFRNKSGQTSGKKSPSAS
jgi:hypothetical protein